MNTKYKYNPLKIITAFMTALIATILSSGSSKTLSAENKLISEQTIEERLSQVRQRIKNLEKANIKESYSILTQDIILEANRYKGEEKPWNNWNDWKNEPPKPKK